jgi:UDP-glucose 4-epimerase
MALPAWLEQGESIRVDLLAEEDLVSVVEGMDAVIHLAAMNEIDCAADPARALLVNGMGTLRLLRAARTAGVRRFIYFSTAHVYGSPLKGSISERTTPRPGHPYAITHRAAEDFVLSAHDRKQLIGIVVRLSNGTGAPVDLHVKRWTLLGNDLCRQAVTAKQLVLRSSGVQKRDFVALSDVSGAVLHLLRLPERSVGDGLFNLGGGHAIRVLDFAEMVADRTERLMGFRPPIVKPATASDEGAHELDYNMDKIEATGFRLKGSLEAEIDRTLLLCRGFQEVGTP